MNQEVFCSSQCCCNKVLRNRCVNFCVHGRCQDQDTFSRNSVDLETYEEELPRRDHFDQPPILEYFELNESSLEFLETIKLMKKPRVEMFMLPPKQKHCSKTLVLDLDETLVHSSLKYVEDADIQLDLQVPDAGHQTVFVKLRPYSSQFLR